MVCAQLVAFGHVSQSREERKVRKEMKREREGEDRKRALKLEEQKEYGESQGNGHAKHIIANENYGVDTKLQELIRDDSEGTEDEIIR